MNVGLKWNPYCNAEGHVVEQPPGDESRVRGERGRERLHRRRELLLHRRQHDEAGEDRQHEPQAERPSEEAPEARGGGAATMLPTLAALLF